MEINLFYTKTQSKHKLDRVFVCVKTFVEYQFFIDQLPQILEGYLSNLQFVQKR